MGCLGVHFAITEADVSQLRAIEISDRADFIRNDLEERYFDEKEHMAESDKAWDFMHRTLSDGELSWDGGTYPLNHTVLAGEQLYDEDDYIMSLKTPAQVKDISQALTIMTEVDFRKRFDRINVSSYLEKLDDQQFKYTWGWFENVRDLYKRAAAANRYVLFTADQ